MVYSWRCIVAQALVVSILGSGCAGELELALGVEDDLSEEIAGADGGEQSSDSDSEPRDDLRPPLGGQDASPEPGDVPGKDPGPEDTQPEDPGPEDTQPEDPGPGEESSGLVVALEQTIEAPPRSGRVYYVDVGGEDSQERDGQSLGQAWASASYAASRVEAGDHTIEIGPGVFVEDTPIRLAAGVLLKGAGVRANSATTLKPAQGWLYEDGSPESNNGYLVVLMNADGARVEDIAFENNEQRGAKAAVYVAYSDGVVVRRIAARDFSLSGVIVNRAKGVEIAQSQFTNNAGRTPKCSEDRDACVRVSGDRQNNSALGNITIIYGGGSLIHHNTIREDSNIGIKGFGLGDRSRVYANDVESRRFALETPHKNEKGFEIFNNRFTNWISVPKNGSYGVDLDEYSSTIRIHDNEVITPVGGVEGPRIYLEIDHNVFRFENIGRFYEDHGSSAGGSVWIHHNVALGLPMGFYWDRNRVADVHLFHNTAFFDENHKNYIIDLSGEGPFERFDVYNNAFISPAQNKGRALPFQKPSPLAMTHNIFEELVEETLPAPYVDLNLVTPAGLSPDSTSRRWLPSPQSAALDSGKSLKNLTFSGRSFAHPVAGQGPDVGAFEAGVTQKVDLCEARFGSSAPDAFTCVQGGLEFTSGEAQWFTVYTDGFAPGPYTLTARLTSSAPRRVDILTGSAEEDLEHWTRTVEVDEVEELVWLGEVHIDETGRLAVRIHTRDASNAALSLSELELTPRF